MALHQHIQHEQEVALTPEQQEAERLMMERDRATYNRTQLNSGALTSLSLHQEAMRQRLMAQARSEVRMASCGTEQLLEMLQVALTAISDTRFSPQVRHRVKETITELVRVHSINMRAYHDHSIIELLPSTRQSWTTFYHIHEE